MLPSCSEQFGKLLGHGLQAFCTQQRHEMVLLTQASQGFDDKEQARVYSICFAREQAFTIYLTFVGLQHIVC